MASSGENAVPCNGCTECCRSGQVLVLHPGQGDRVETYQHQTITDHSTGATVYALASENGRCVYLSPTGCTIYSRRPLLCRSFDCREYFLIVPKQDRDNLVNAGLAAKAVFLAGESRANTLSPAQRKACLKKRAEFFL